MSTALRQAALVTRRATVSRPSIRHEHHGPDDAVDVVTATSCPLGAVAEVPGHCETSSEMTMMAILPRTVPVWRWRMACRTFPSG